MIDVWWNMIRLQLGLSRLTAQEAIDQYTAMSCGEIDNWLFKVAYGQIEEESIHSFNDREWWLSPF